MGGWVTVGLGVCGIVGGASFHGGIPGIVLVGMLAGRTVITTAEWLGSKVGIWATGAVRLWMTTGAGSFWAGSRTIRVWKTVTVSVETTGVD
ncbi:hypothetical protein BU24DRAFT_425721, partial [Aaosphaeria arxii CBS 175.79]